MAKGSSLNRKEMIKEEKIEERKNMVSINTNIVGFPFHHEFSKFMFDC